MLVVKHTRACGVWEVDGAPCAANNNRGKCWSKAWSRGRKLVQKEKQLSEQLNSFILLSQFHILSTSPN